MIQEKLTTSFISQYKTVFSEQLIAQAFNEKEKLTGKEILYISPIKQLNLFIIKSLFERWQEEMQRIESPYFDYHATEVKVMISKFMNILSQNIFINAENLKPIIEKAVEDLIILNFDPASYLDNEIKKKPELLKTKKLVPQFAKYLVFYKSLILDFLHDFDIHDLKHLKKYAVAFFEKETLDKYPLIEQLSEILIIEKQELFEISQSIKKNNEFIITGSERMKNRPIKILVEALNDLGANISYKDKEGFPPLLIKGKEILGGEISLSSQISSQYISALMLIAPILKKGLLVNLEGKMLF